MDKVKSFEDEYIENMIKERNTHQKGFNPYFGELKMEFRFTPRAYDSPEREKFKCNIQKQLSNVKYMFYGEVKLTITLYFNEKKRYETSDYGDLDNYAKVICDAIKGYKGVLIDDSQIQSLQVLWIDTYCEPYFSIEITSMPEKYIMKPVIMIQLYDKMYYPFSCNEWSENGPKKISSDKFNDYLNIYQKIVKEAKMKRHKLRTNKVNELDAYYTASICAPYRIGFHKSRVADSGLELMTFKDLHNEK